MANFPCILSLTKPHIYSCSESVKPLSHSPHTHTLVISSSCNTNLLMDLFFDADKGMSFTVEVGYFDTIQEIKEKVTKYHGIPLQQQTLEFDGKTLPDDLNIHTSHILDGSRLKLITTYTSEPQQQATTKVKTEEPPSPYKIKILVKPFGASMDMDMNDPVLKIKEKMNETEGIPLTRMVVYANGVELHDHKSLHEYQLVDGSQVEMTLKPPTPPPSLSMGLLSKKMKVHVMSKCGEKIGLEVNPSSNVGDLRKELERVRRHQGVGFRLPEEGYFFIYKQNVMEEDRSFKWHRVRQGDTIEIFNGCVTGGS